MEVSVLPPDKGFIFHTPLLLIACFKLRAQRQVSFLNSFSGLSQLSLCSGTHVLDQHRAKKQSFYD